jgi:hypothetical protein
VSSSKALALLLSPALPALVAASGDRAGVRFVEFFTATIRNPHTRRAYGRAVGDFLAWCRRGDDWGALVMLHEGIIQFLLPYPSPLDPIVYPGLFMSNGSWEYSGTCPLHSLQLQPPFFRRVQLLLCERQAV